MSNNVRNQLPPLRTQGPGDGKTRNMPIVPPPLATTTTTTPKEQWPLHQSTSTRSLAPHRPPRPQSRDIPADAIPIASNIPSIVPIIQPPQQANRLTVPGRPPFYPSPNNSRPVTGVSIASTSSRYSTGEGPSDVPDFPQDLADNLQQDERYSQQLQAQPRVRAPLGPPPSARRGPASYYSQHIQVDPIEEESDSNKGSARPRSDMRTSFASSNVMTSGVPDYYFNANASTDATPPSQPSPTKAAGRVLSVDSDTLPATTRPAPDVTLRSPPRKPINSRNETSRPPPPGTQDSDTTLQTVSSGALGRYNSSYYAPSTVDVEKSWAAAQEAPTFMPASRSLEAPPPLAYDTTDIEGDPRVISVLGRLTKGGALGFAGDDDDDDSDTDSIVLPEPQPVYRSQHSQTQKPGRMSMTSLSGMIARATTLASNLDRGRTASRIGTQWFDGEKRGGAWQRQSEFSDAFPPSAFANDGLYAQRHSDRPEMPRRVSRWPGAGLTRMLPSRDKSSPLRSFDTTSNKSGRRVLGMALPRFFFVLLIIALLLLVAVLLPVVLVVLPRQSENKPLSLETCQEQLPCMNDGVSHIGDRGMSCQCVCVNGHTGATCTAAPAEECAGVTLDRADNATVGDAIPRLISDSPSNFSITLEPAIILGIFSTTNLTCASENALMTFNGNMGRSFIPNALDDDDDLASSETDSVAGGLQKRQTSAKESFISSTAVALADSTSARSNNTRALDIARVAVLFVLQDSNELNDAIVAQQKLQQFFVDGGTDAVNGQSDAAKKVDVGSGYEVDLDLGQITRPNGTVVGESKSS